MGGGRTSELSRIQSPTGISLPEFPLSEEMQSPLSVAIQEFCTVALIASNQRVTACRNQVQKTANCRPKAAVAFP